MDDELLNSDARDRSDGPILFVVAGRSEEEHASEAHRHRRGQLFGSLSGLLTVGLEGGMWLVPAIHAVWLPPNHFHSGRTHGPFHGWSAYVAEDACASLPTEPCTLRTSGLLREAVLRASTWRHEGFEALDAPQASLAEVILEEIRTLPVESLGLPLPRDARLQRICKALIADPADDRDLEAWASWAATSSRTLSRRFAAETGFAFTTWRQRARLMRSLEMLAAGQPVTSIALDLGYSTPSAFIGVFRRTFGDTPAAYRSRLGSDAPYSRQEKTP